MRQNAFGGRALPGPAGELERSPRPPSRNWGCLLLRGEGREGGKGRKGMGRGKGGRSGGEGGKGKDDLHPTLFLGPARPRPKLARQVG